MLNLPRHSETISPMDLEAIKTSLQSISDDNDADLYMFSGPVVPKAERRFNELLREHKKRKNVLCLTTTYGGSADVAYQMVRAVRRYYPDGHFILFVDSLCKSAGTLIALGANCIVMSDTAELGPLDVQVQKPGEMGEFISGLTHSQALATLQDALFESFEFYFLNLRSRSQGQISTRTAAELAVEMVVGSFRPIYEQFDPTRLGENERSVAIARAYGQRIKTSNVKNDAIEQLVNGYPSHGFVIDRDEASDLFKSVRAPSEAELAIAKLLRKSNEEALLLDEPVIRHLGYGGKDDEKSDAPEHGDTEESSCQENHESPAKVGAEVNGSFDDAAASNGSGD